MPDPRGFWERLRRQLVTAPAKGLAEAGYATGIGLSGLVSSKAADSLRQSREEMRDFYGESETTGEKVAEGATRLVGTAAQYAAGGALVRGAAGALASGARLAGSTFQGARAAQAATRAADVLAKVAKPQGFAARAAEDFISGSALSIPVAMGNPEESVLNVAGERGAELAKNPVNRFVAELGVNAVTAGLGAKVATVLESRSAAKNASRARPAPPPPRTTSSAAAEVVTPAPGDVTPPAINRSAPAEAQPPHTRQADRSEELGPSKETAPDILHARDREGNLKLDPEGQPILVGRRTTDQSRTLDALEVKKPEAAAPALDTSYPADKLPAALDAIDGSIERLRGLQENASAAESVAIGQEIRKLESHRIDIVGGREEPWRVTIGRDPAGPAVQNAPGRTGGAEPPGGAAGSGSPPAGGGALDYEADLRAQAAGTKTLREGKEADEVLEGTAAAGKPPGPVLLNKSALLLDPSGETLWRQAEERLVKEGMTKTTVSDKEIFEKYAPGVDVPELIKSGKVALSTPQLAALGQTLKSLNDELVSVTTKLESLPPGAARDAADKHFDDVWTTLDNLNRRFTEAGSEAGRSLRILGQIAGQQDTPGFASRAAKKMLGVKDLPPEVDDGVKKIWKENPVPAAPVKPDIPEVESVSAKQMDEPAQAATEVVEASKALKKARTPAQTEAAKKNLAKARERAAAVRAANPKAAPEPPATPDTQGVSATEFDLARDRQAAEAGRKKLAEGPAGAPDTRPSTDVETAERSARIKELAGLQRQNPALLSAAEQAELKALRQADSEANALATVNPLERLAKDLATEDQAVVSATAKQDVLSGKTPPPVKPEPVVGPVTEYKQSPVTDIRETARRQVDSDAAAGARAQAEFRGAPGTKQQGPKQISPVEMHTKHDPDAELEGWIEGQVQRAEKEFGYSRADRPAELSSNSAEFPDKVKQQRGPTRDSRMSAYLSEKAKYDAALKKRQLAVAGYLQGMRKQNIGELIFGTRKWGMLTNTVSHLVNITSGLTKATMESFVVQPVAAAFDRLKNSPANRTVLSNTDILKAKVKGGLQAGKDVFKNRASLLKSIDPDNPLDALNRERLNYVGSLGLDKESPSVMRRTMNRILKPGAQLLQLGNDAVYAALNAPDQVLYKAALAGRIEERAQLRAMREGLKRGSAEFKSRVTELRQLQNIHEDDAAFATLEALKEVFKDQNAMVKLANKAGRIPVVGPLVAPYTTTPTNIIMDVIEATPFLGAAVEKGGAKGRDIAQAGKGIDAGRRAFEKERRQMLSLARQSGVGAGLVGVGYWMYANNMATGPYQEASTSEEKNEANKQKMQDAPRNSVRIGNKWVSTYTLGPYGLILNIGAGLAAGVKEGSFAVDEARKNVRDADTPAERAKAREGVAMERRSIPGRAAGKAAEAFGTTLLDMPMLQGTKQITDLVGGRKKPGPELGRMAASFIPFSAATAAGAKALDPARDRMVESFGDAIQERIPVMRESLPVKPGTFGETARGPGAAAFLDPFKFRDVRMNAPIERLIEDNIGIAQSPRKSGETADDYSRRLQVEGRAIRRAMQNLTGTPLYRQSDEAGKRELARETIRSAKSMLNF